MPIYEYRCTACQHKFESLQKFSDAPLVTCTKCAKDALTKLVSAAGFQLKGSGWYQTDFRGGSKPAEKSKSDTPAADAKPAETAKTDKSESASTTKSESTSTPATPAASGPAASA